MKFINKDKLAKLDKIVSENTSIRFQTRYDIILNPENTAEAYFCVLCAYIPGMVNSGTNEEKDKQFSKLYAELADMIEETKISDAIVVAKYSPKDKPTVIEVYLDDRANITK